MRGGNNLDKKDIKELLSEYIDACELIKETEADIRKFEKRKKTIVQDKVKGSMPEFPYAETSFHIEGALFCKTEDIGALLHEEMLLEERKKDAEQKKYEVEVFMNAIPIRMQRIIRFRYFENLPWEQVAQNLGRNVTADSVRKELKRFLEKK